jgi:hypothetical protein
MPLILTGSTLGVRTSVSSTTPKSSHGEASGQPRRDLRLKFAALCEDPVCDRPGLEVV